MRGFYFIQLIIYFLSHFFVSCGVLYYMKTKTNKYQKRMSPETISTILDMHKKGEITVNISKAIDFSSSSVLNVLRKNGLTSNFSEIDRSRKCVVCGGVFTPKSRDGYRKDRYLNCSRECELKTSAKKRKKYSDSQIDEVIKLKKLCVTNKEISIKTGVNINTIKKVIKENGLFVSKQQAQKNAQKKKAEYREIRKKGGEPPVLPNYNDIARKTREYKAAEAAKELVSDESASIYSLSKKYNIERGILADEIKKIGDITSKSDSILNLKIENAINDLKKDPECNLNILSKRYKISNRVLKKYITQKGFGDIIPNRLEEFPNKVSFMVDELKKEDSKESVSSMSHKLGISDASASNELKKRGLGHLVRAIKTKEECQAIMSEIVPIMDDTSNKYSVTYLANKKGISPGVARRYLHEMGRSDLVRKGVSAQEQDVCDFVCESLPSGVEVEQSNRTILDGLEIDIYIPSLKLGIEYCGIYWHSEQQGKGAYYHYDKYKKCKDKGVTLITIFSNDWEDRRKAVETTLLTYLVKDDLSMSCLVPIKNKLAKTWLNENAINVNEDVRQSFALKVCNEIKGVITIGKSEEDVTNISGFSAYKMMSELVKKRKRSINVLVNNSYPIALGETIEEIEPEKHTIDDYSWYDSGFTKYSFTTHRGIY